MPMKRSSTKASSPNKKHKTDEAAAFNADPPEAALALRLHAEPPEVAVPSQANVVEPSEAANEEPEEYDCRFIGDPVPADEARRRWPHRYKAMIMGNEIAGSKSSKLNINSEEIIQARRHYTKVEVDGRLVFNLEDEAHVKADEGKDNHVCRIVEMFEGKDGSPYFTAQWYYGATDTVIQNSLKYLELTDAIDNKRVFCSEVKDDNPLNCLVERLRIVRLASNVDILAKESAITDCDTKYRIPYSSFVSLDNDVSGNESEWTLSSDTDSVEGRSKQVDMSLLDLYCGCGAMSTGLCPGANMGGSNLVTGANFRNLEGVRVHADNKVEWDPDVKRVYLASGKSLVPDYAMSFVDGNTIHLNRLGGYGGMRQCQQLLRGQNLTIRLYCIRNKIGFSQCMKMLDYMVFRTTTGYLDQSKKGIFCHRGLTKLISQLHCIYEANVL